MRTIWLSFMVMAVVSATPSARSARGAKPAAKPAPAPAPEAPVTAAADPPPVPGQLRPADEKALRCLRLGHTFGLSYYALNDQWRGKLATLEAYCARQPDPATGKVPTDAQVDELMGALQGFLQQLGRQPLLDYTKLKDDTRQMEQEERRNLERLLAP